MVKTLDRRADHPPYQTVRSGSGEGSSRSTLSTRSWVTARQHGSQLLLRPCGPPGDSRPDQPVRRGPGGHPQRLHRHTERRLRVLRLKEGPSRNVAQGDHALARVQSSWGRRQADGAAAGSGAEVGQMRWSQVALNGCNDAYRLTRIPCKQGFPCSSAAWQHCCGPGCRGFESHRSPHVKALVRKLRRDHGQGSPTAGCPVLGAKRERQARP
jgi:hypothetical protein